MKCTVCGKKVSKGVIERGLIYCSEEHAHEHWCNGLADNWAFEEAQGLYRSFNEYMEYEVGAVIADDHCYPRREY